MKQKSISMPMSSAGIIGVSPDIKIGGMDIEPKMLIIAIIVIVVIVQIAGFFVQ